MSTNVSAHVLRNFIVKTIDGDSLSHDKIQTYDITNNEFNDADENDDNVLDIDEILDNDDLYAKFATMFVDEQEKAEEEKDAEKEKDEKNKVKDKSGAGAA